MSTEVNLYPNNNEVGHSAPLMLWCASHRTLAAEEIPLLCQAGFRVVPLLTDLWTNQYAPSLDAVLCNSWKATVALSSEILAKLQSLPIYSDVNKNSLNSSDIEFLNEHVSVIYVTVYPAVAIRLAEVFKGLVIFRPFGHGSINNYSNILRSSGIDLRTFSAQPNFGWVPILSTLQEPEDPRICANTTFLNAFVSPDRLPAFRWNAEESCEYVVETIPRIEQQQYYRDVYNEFTANFQSLPLKILGGNSKGGGKLNDPRIVGFLEDEDYFKLASKARLSIYHGTSRYHLHYHPLELMTLGVPVLFSRQSAIANEALTFGLTSLELEKSGMFDTLECAAKLAKLALSDPKYAEEWSNRQQTILKTAFSRSNALFQARWLKTRTLQLNDFRYKIEQASTTAQHSPHELRKRKSILSKIVREAKRLLRKGIATKS